MYYACNMKHNLLSYVIYNTSRKNLPSKININLLLSVKFTLFISLIYFMQYFLISVKCVVDY